MELVRSGPGRDLRVDFFRGLALWWIFVDHIPGNVMATYSLHTVALCDAAEVFVLLAGFGAAKAYAGVMDRQGWLLGAADTLKRAWVLYVAHIFLFVVYAAQVSYSAAALDRTYYLDESKLDVLAGAPYQALLQALALRYQPSLLNILPLYVVLLVMFALAMPLLRLRWWALGLSVGLYVLARDWDLNLPGWHGTGWYFDPLAWQLLFMIGALLAYAPPPMPPRRVRHVLDVLAVADVVAGLVLIFVVWPHPAMLDGLPIPVAHGLLWMDKTTLDPPRLAEIMALVWLVVRLVPMHAPWLLSRPARFFVLLGQHSLPVFCFGIFLGFLARLVLHEDDGVLMQIAVNLGGALAMLGLAALTAWHGQRGRAARHPTGPALEQ